MILRIRTDFKIMRQDPKQRLLIDGIDSEVATKLWPGMSIVIYDENLQVDAIVEYENGSWLALPKWETRIDLGQP